MPKNIKGKYSEEASIASDKILIELNKARKTFDLGKLTYKDLEKEIGIDNSNISKTFRGIHSISLAHFFQFCFVFNKDPMELIKMVDPLKILKDSLENRNLVVEDHNPKEYSQSKSSKKHVIICKKIKWKDIYERKLAIGETGELLAVEFERQRLRELGLDELADNVVHSSIELGDGLGYDIKSFDPKTKEEIFIEVKATTGNLFNDLNMTSNELNFMELNSRDYYIYRFYNIDLEERKGELEIFQGKKQINDVFEIIPSTYKLRKKS